MSGINSKDFVGYEYTTVMVKKEMESMVVDGYENFGWNLEGRVESFGVRTTGMKFKRDRKIRNKGELSRLQREFDVRIREIETLEASKTSSAQIAGFTVGMIGTVLLGSGTFAYLAGFVPLMVICAIPGFMGWILPYFIYNKVLQNKEVKVSGLIESQYETAYEICEKANGLLAV